jgi:hypothetical protein
MTEKLPVIDVSTAEVASFPAKLPSLSELVARIREDSMEGSQEYLDETNVPHGGE